MYTLPFLAANPFFEAYIQSDFMGKLIFLGLLALSIASWTVLFQKMIYTRKARLQSQRFQEAFQMQKLNPLSLEITPQTKTATNPFLNIYQVMRKHTLDILNKNHRFSPSDKENQPSYLSPTDIDFVESHLATTIASQTKQLEKNLYVLSTIVTLAPFLGLLGTVWGILTTFSELQTHVSGSAHQMVLGGLSLALATTVLGLIDAIPALIGYNYLKNKIKDFQTDMEGFANEMLSSVELQYRQVDVKNH
jgi:biopolymer transport protein TolQ